MFNYWNVGTEHTFNGWCMRTITDIYRFLAKFNQAMSRPTRHHWRKPHLFIETHKNRKRHELLNNTRIITDILEMNLLVLSMHTNQWPGVFNLYRKPRQGYESLKRRDGDLNDVASHETILNPRILVHIVQYIMK